MELRDDPRVQVGAYISRGRRLYRVERAHGDFVTLEDAKTYKWILKRVREITLGGYRLERCAPDSPE